MPASLSVTTAVPGAPLPPSDALVFLGRGARLLEPDVLRLLPESVGEPVFTQMVRKSDPGDTGRLVTTWTAGTPARVSAALLPEPCSRHNSPSRAFAVGHALQGALHKGDVTVVACLDHADHAAAVVMAVARCLPTWQGTSSPQVDRRVNVVLLPREGGGIVPERLLVAAEAVREAAASVDQPPDTMNCDAMVEWARAVGARTGAEVTVIRGAELAELGLGGLWGVGKAAAQAPALVTLAHGSPDAATRRAWVGKGIVYDTGGLSIKAKTSMPGMKTDMAGAAAVLAAFGAAVSLGAPDRLVAALCVAENAVGPGSVRPDDVLRMYSGRTVEVNNTDAEGRLVLADGVAWVARHHAPTEVLDLATLTGAQSVATGKHHAALHANDDALERRLFDAGRRVGELAFPIPYAPEFFRGEFRSPVADMRNSVKDRSNAQASCAAQFIGNHLVAAGYDGPWCHVDMAAPAVSGHRGTGYGVGLLLASAGLI
ncbi:MAG: leucyl aminopeptidase family protein [Alphaproteobacteria bacterium]|nr:leucyl aminopeptidase family protein [Alphaproteobacteria bacterium]